jgi:hypothetical protein
VRVGLQWVASRQRWEEELRLANKIPPRSLEANTRERKREEPRDGTKEGEERALCCGSLRNSWRAGPCQRTISVTCVRACL